nr:DegT/DnrJ/EryC1/StrS family aminotransferase [bacterium]
GFCTFSATKYFNTFGGGMATTSDKALGEKLKKMSRELPAPNLSHLARAVAIAALMKLLTSPPLFSAVVFPIQFLMSLFSSDLLNVYNPTIHRFKEPRGKAHGYSNLQAYIGRQWLRRIDGDNRRRAQNAKLLNELLDPAIFRLEDPPGCYSIYWLYMLMSEEPVLFSNILLRSGIDTGKFFMGNCADENFPNTDLAARNSVQIPLNPGMDEPTIIRIAEAVNKAHDRLRKNASPKSRRY